MMFWAPRSCFGDVPFCFIQSLRCEHGVLVPILIVSLLTFQMKRHSGLSVVLLGLASAVAGQPPSRGFMDNMNFDDFIHSSQTPG